MRSALLAIGLTACGGLGVTAATASAAPLPPDIGSAYLCTTYGIHGYTGTNVYVQLHDAGGSYDSYGPPGVNPFGSISSVSYAVDANTVEGYWHANGQNGWFRWAFYDDYDFYGSWGYGPQIAEREAGFWNGHYCPQ